MTELTSEAYAAEIREWLVGRLSRSRLSGAIPLQAPEILSHAPILFWWIFEGKRYDGLDGPLSHQWHVVDHQFRRLLTTCNPVRRAVDLPEGETDWVATAFHSVTSARRVFVSRASRQGLGEKELTALFTWRDWIEATWEEYIGTLGTPVGSPSDLPLPSRSDFPTKRPSLRWCAHIARRSRWPLLRNVVAESIRCALEPQELDRLPLPSDPATLFELLCMVRILRTLAPNAAHVRWIGLETGANTVAVSGMRYFYQRSLDDDLVLGTREFDEGLRDAVRRHEVRIHRQMDGWLVFEEPRAGFRGILVEAKSGIQGADAAIFQLKCYRAALKRESPEPLLVWGVAEQHTDGGRGRGGAAEVPSVLSHRRDEDLWVFSSARAIPAILRALGLAGESMEASECPGVKEGLSLASSRGAD